jgi:uncharacterized protein YdaU (DUF1376 family)
MANTNKRELSPVAVAANVAGEEKRQREAKARRSNAEKQRTFRSNMKAKGFKEVKVWEKPPEPGFVRAWNGASPVIHEVTAGVCARDEKTRGAVDAMMNAFFRAMRGDEKEMAGDAWAVYGDVKALLAPLGYRD